MSISSSKSNNQHKIKQDFPPATDHFENSTSGLLASTSTLIKAPSSHINNLINNNTSKIEIPIKKFNPNSEQIQVLTNHTNNPSKPTMATKIDDKLDKMKWFHGLLTRENAEKLLVNDGDYLVRETNKAERQYVLSGRYKGECRHIFLVDPSGVVNFFI